MTAVIENPAEHRFELPIPGAEPAVVYYRLDQGVMVLVHTAVPMERMGQGYASRLAAGVVERLRESGRKARPQCEFMARYALRRPEDRDVLSA